MGVVTMDLEARGLTVTEGLDGGLSEGQRICIIGAGPHCISNPIIDQLERGGIAIHYIDDDGEVRGIDIDKMFEDDLKHGIRFSALMKLVSIDEVQYLGPEKKRKGKRKNANPYQYSMKRGGTR